MRENLFSQIMSILGKLFSAKKEEPKPEIPEKPTVFEKKEESVLMEKVPITSKSKKIRSIINVWETGKKEGSYSLISIYGDGPGNRRQITLGFGLIEYGSLKDCLELYILKGGAYAGKFGPYMKNFGNTKYPSLSDNKAFIQLLKDASNNDQLMRDAQDEIWDKQYLKPAMKFFKDNGFTLPMSELVLVDSFVHSGSVPSYLRKRFPAVPPSKGGDEQEWVKQYLVVRRDWLKNHSRKILHNTAVRSENMLAQIEKGDWMLERPFVANGVVVA